MVLSIVCCRNRNQVCCEIKTMCSLMNRTKNNMFPATMLIDSYDMIKPNKIQTNDNAADS